MNKQKEQEMQENIAFLRQQLDQLEPNVTLPQSLRGEQLLRRLKHTKAAPKPALHQPYWRLVPAACAFVLVLGLSAYAVSAGGWKSNSLVEAQYDMAAVPEAAAVEDYAQEPPMAADAAPKSAVYGIEAVEEEAIEEVTDALPEEMLESEVAGAEPFLFSVGEKNEGPAPQEREAPEEEGVPAPVPESNSFEDYSQLQQALGQMHQKQKGGVYFGQANEYQPELYGRGEVLSYAGHSLYVAVDPETGEDADLLYIIGKDGQTVKKEIQLPPQSVAELFAGQQENTLFVIAAQETAASMLVLDLETYGASSYSQPGEYQQCFANEEALFIVTAMEVDQADLKDGEYVPYLMENGEKQALSLEQIYAAGGNEPWYTVISRLPFTEAEPAQAVAVLGGKAEVSLGQKELSVENSQGERLVFSAKNLTPVQ